MYMPKGVLIDLTRCTGCRGCQAACKEWNERKARRTTLSGNFTNPSRLNSDCYTHIRFHEQEMDGVPVWSFVKNQCLHCKKPACASACPVGALAKTEAGPVIYHFDRCIGCRYCMLACPFEIPKYEWESAFPWVQKCSFCSERIRDGLVPACIKTCPTETMLYGEYDDIVKEAKARIRRNPGKYVPHIYGLEEAGGTSWIYISGVPFDKIGFNTHVGSAVLPAITWKSLAKIPFSVTALVALLGAIAWIRNRGEIGGQTTDRGPEAEGGTRKTPAP
ncbi:MAG: hypothetical protein CO150_04255 [Nitrospirae bacterium CG_4_9_14_3_um_filter_53_35]|nr:MAG: hypothetical protein COT35_13745 [Nitrospirae bacterium CG08_land_8_20_14_0_20_52_24]PIV82565.1 MAG: hypothetical protein COW52_12900 [Nitrospirae bacterium CG17_big_fil_post_rev_8_21_14_2_50_50_9]PIW85599.1 MAG: hypothetical protein COZ95_03710 [Nitrospirae bacterium CG_4_8_14_3_um_filter_50_41]PIX85179.1 MAG: hypothetical protein COZ32_09855 [Nitrospirae bacterium CG_4_10_14_3_um_filter_53_41]PJA75814.1 MAG: hypothetical protein CO150_04255 [Nitrospirae bacterium CG_4_9_14_3_um_filter